MKNSKNNNKRGTVLMVSVFITSFLIIMMIAYGSFVTTSYNTTQTTAEAVQADFIAESAAFMKASELILHSEELLQFVEQADGIPNEEGVVELNPDMLGQIAWEESIPLGVDIEQPVGSFNLGLGVTQDDKVLVYAEGNNKGISSEVMIVLEFNPDLGETGQYEIVSITKD